MQSQNSLSKMVAYVPSTLMGILYRDTADPLNSPMSTGLGSIEQTWSLSLGRPYHDLLMGLRANQIPAAPIPLPETLSLTTPSHTQIIRSASGSPTSKRSQLRVGGFLCTTSLDGSQAGAVFSLGARFPVWWWFSATVTLAVGNIAVRPPSWRPCICAGSVPGVSLCSQGLLLTVAASLSPCLPLIMCTGFIFSSHLFQ